MKKVIIKLIGRASHRLREARKAPIPIIRLTPISLNIFLSGETVRSLCKNISIAVADVTPTKVLVLENIILKKTIKATTATNISVLESISCLFKS